MEKIITIVEKWLAVPLLVTIFVTLLLQVFSRYVVGRPIRWTVEFSNLCLIWLTFIGAAICYRNNDMVKLDVFLEYFPQKIQDILYLAQDILFIILSLVYIYIGSRLAFIESGRTLHTIPVTRAVRFIPIPIGFFLILIVAVNKIKNSNKNRGAQI